MRRKTVSAGLRIGEERLRSSIHSQPLRWPWQPFGGRSKWKKLEMNSRGKAWYDLLNSSQIVDMMMVMIVVAVVAVVVMVSLPV